MLFVPLPLFAGFCLVIVLIHMIATRDMGLRANRLFVLLVGLYALQTVLLCLRWGYGIEQVRLWIALIAPLLPVCAFLAYRALSGPPVRWPLGVIALDWLAVVARPDLADVLIPLTYLGFGGLILRLAWAGSDLLPLARINAAPGALRAMVVTGAALVASALTDIYVIYDFITNDGRSVGLVVTFVQTLFLLAIGLSALSGQAGAEGVESSVPRPEPVTQDDHALVARVTALFSAEGLHRDEDLSLRRLARRLGVPDRSLSGAINRIEGVNVSQFVNGFRVREACTLLETTDQTVLQISLAAGFSTKSNFNREFVRVTGRTPTQWRRDPPAPK